MSEPVEADEPNGRVTTLSVVRGYVLLVVGVGLIIWSFVGGTNPGALTLGGALIGFNPVLRAAVSSERHESK